MPSPPAFSLRLFTSVAVVCWASVSCAAKPDEPVNALTRALEATEWIYDVDSVLLRATIRISRPEAAIAAHREKLLREHGGEVPEEILRGKFELQPQSDATLVLGWDNKRAAYRFDAPDWLHEVDVWDGSQGITQMKWVAYSQNDFQISKTPGSEINGRFFSWLPWSLTHQHIAPLQVAGIDRVAKQAERDSYGKQSRHQEMQEHSGVKFEGVDCTLYGVPNPGTWDRFYVDTATRRLRGMNVGSHGLVSKKLTYPIIQRHLAELGIEVNSFEEVDAAFAKLSPQQQEELRKKHAGRTGKIWWEHLPEVDPLWTIVLEDWREVVPGHEFPFLQVFQRRDVIEEESLVSETRVITIDELTINRTLSDDLFTLTVDEGANVYDATHDPPLRYTQDSNRTPDEWAALIAKARQNSDEDQEEQRVLDELIGAPAPELTGAFWMNSDPLTWEQLRGRYVILAFWHIGCGPCWNSMRWMQPLHEKRDDAEGMTVIGIHGDGASAEQIQEVLKEQLKGETTFPICVDRPLEDEAAAKTFPSEIFHRYRVRRMPFAWLVGPEGTLIAHGDLPALVEEARELLRGEETK